MSNKRIVNFLQGVSNLAFDVGLLRLCDFLQNWTNRLDTVEDKPND